MSRNESDREDLMREAVALTRRLELLPTDATEPVVMGFRESTGWFSIYFGQDPVYTWDEEGRLRRSYEDGYLFRTQGVTLARLERIRDEHGTELRRHDLTATECRAFVERMRSRAGDLERVLSEGACVVTACVGDEAKMRADALAALQAIRDQSQPLAPALPGKR